MRWLAAAFQWQSRAVVERHLRVHLRNWHTAFLPPALEPVTNLLAFGIGLEGWVGTVVWRDRDVDYLTFIAPGLLAYATFMTAMFQSLYAAFIRMHYQKTWEGQLTSQVELRHVVWGEVLWSASLATIYASVVAVVLAACWLLVPLVATFIMQQQRFRYLLPLMPGAALLVGWWLDREARAARPRRALGLFILASACVGVAGAAITFARLDIAATASPIALGLVGGGIVLLAIVAAGASWLARLAPAMPAIAALCVITIAVVPSSWLIFAITSSTSLPVS